MPSHSLGDATPANVPNEGAPESSGDGQADTAVQITMSATISRAESPTTPLEWSGGSIGGSAMLGWPPSLPPPSPADIASERNSMLTGGVHSHDSSGEGLEETKSGICAGQGERTLAFEAQEGEVLSSSAQEMLPTRPTADHENTRFMLGVNSVCSSSTVTYTKPPGAARVTVANAAIARAKREASDSRARPPTVLTKRRPTSPIHAPRPPFNFDNAQAASSGMYGVGVAVPIGFSDAR